MLRLNKTPAEFMNTHPHRELRRNSGLRRLTVISAAVLACACLTLDGCTSASSGHAPGVAPGQPLQPGITNYPLAYVKRPVPTTDIDVRDLITSTTGGDLYVRTQANATGTETNVTRSLTQGKGDVRDLDVSPDGTKLLFSLRLPLDPKRKNTDPRQPNWHIYQYDIVARSITQLTNDTITAGHDVGGRYLPDGRIVFSSTRQSQTQAILLNEGRPQYPAQTDDRQSPIFLLHVMNADGSGIHQISFNTNHDFAPSVMNNGQVLFSRWENDNGASQISLYRVNPDGTGLELYYGANSHATGANAAGTNNNVIQFLGARQRLDGKTLALVRPFLGTQLGGDIVLIDGENFVEIGQTTLASAGAAAPGQTSATTFGATTDANLPSLGGRFAALFPLYDGTNRMLASWTPCLVQDTTQTPAAAVLCTAANTTGANVQASPPLYSLWLFDFDKNTSSPVLAAETGTMILDPVILQARKPAPVFLPDSRPSTPTQQNLVNAGVGILRIYSIYDVDGVDTAQPNIATTADPAQAEFYARPYRFIRLVKAVEIPDKTVRKLNGSAFGPAGMGMREILGYAPVQPDGSVEIQVPAMVPFTIDILDANGQRVTTRHTSWLQLMPGETRTCNGCHSTAANRATPSHGRSGLTRSVNPGAPAAGQSFPHTTAGLTATTAGEVMATTLAIQTCGTSAKTESAASCSQVPSADVIYTPVWTTGITPPAGLKDTTISYPYNKDSTGSGAVGLSTPVPINANCFPWSAQCRITIQYAQAQPPGNPQAIQTVWNFSRPANSVIKIDHTCTLCHNTLNAVPALQVPLGQLDLTGGGSTVDPTVVTSYEQLLFPHNEQTLNMAGGLQDLLVPQPGPPDPATGLPTTIMVPVSLAAPMVAGSALGSSVFFGVFGAGGTHSGYLTPAELRLISEWLDIGGQFYNDPFVAPAAP